MKATARRENGSLRHAVEMRGHTLVADEPKDEGGEDSGPSPQEMYAKRKGWEVGEVSVHVEYEPAQRGSPTRFRMTVDLPKELPENQRERLMQIGAKCPVHRVLEGEVMFEESVELV